jgi:GLPGLI family protein
MRFLFLIIPFLFFSQNKYEVKYNMLTLFDGPKNYESRLLFADSYSNFEYKLSAKDTAQTESQDNNGVFQISIPDKKNYRVYLNSKKKVISEIKYLGGSENKVLVQDSLILPKWKIYQETKKINNLVCYRATTSFKGRNYEAWYTLDYPTQYGPWKLNGLPGLIIKAQDDKNEVFFEAIAIIPTNEKIDEEPPLLKTMSSEEYVNAVKKNLKDFEARIGSMADRNTKITVKTQYRGGIELN